MPALLELAPRESGTEEIEPKVEFPETASPQNCPATWDCYTSFDCQYTGCSTTI